MTGFASTSREFPGGLLAMELRAVNHHAIWTYNFACRKNCG